MTWVQTFTGKRFDLLDPKPESVDIVDIAHSLSMQCRFNGHCSEFYSVAQHSVHVCDTVVARFDGTPRQARLGLIHDAAEAYIGDIVRPLKLVLGDIVPGIEDGILNVISYALDAFWTPADWVVVRDSDEVLLATEARDVMGPAPADWGVRATPCPGKLTPMPQPAAFAMFLQTWHRLNKEPF